MTELSNSVQFDRQIRFEIKDLKCPVSMPPEIQQEVTCMY